MITSSAAPPNLQKRHQSRLDRLGEVRIDHWRAKQADAERVHRRSPLAHLEMEVRAGRKTGRADIADQLPGADEASRLRDDLAHVAVEADDAAPMSDLHLAAVAAGPAGADHLSVRRGNDRAAPASADVDPRMK